MRITIDTPVESPADAGLLLRHIADQLSRGATRGVQPSWHLTATASEAARSFTVSSSAIGRCKTTRLDPKHYRPDGTCECFPPDDESLEPHLVRGYN